MKVTVYSKPNCVACDATKRYLTDKGIEFDVVDVMADEQALQHGYEVEEEPLYYAKTKLSGLMNHHENIYLSYEHGQRDEYGIIELLGGFGFVNQQTADERTLDGWESIGVNDENADFVKVEELEE